MSASPCCRMMQLKHRSLLPTISSVTRNEMEPQHQGNAALALITPEKQMKQTWARKKMGWLNLRVAALCLIVVSSAAPFTAQQAQPAGVASRPVAVAKPSSLSDAAALVTEFDVNGLKVLVKRRE